MLNMPTLYNRLLEICHDRGIPRPKGVDIQQLTGLSSGRITQIKSDGTAAKLGEKTLREIMKLGYSGEWLQTGRGSKYANARQEGEANAVAEPLSSAYEWPFNEVISYAAFCSLTPKARDWVMRRMREAVQECRDLYGEPSSKRRPKSDR
jgi:hypothetical protein